MRKSKIVVFGGAFNPPTLAHEAIIEALLDLPHFTEVWAMVSGDRIDKHMAVSDEHRMRMLELAMNGVVGRNPRFKISDFELTMPRPTQTYKTIEALERAYPNAEFWFAFGADSYDSILSWPNGAKLRDMLQKLVLFERSDKRAAAHKNTIRLQISNDFKDVSSTELRRLAANGTRLDGLVNNGVAAYIAEQKLYI